MIYYFPHLKIKVSNEIRSNKKGFKTIEGAYVQLHKWAEKIPYSGSYECWISEYDNKNKIKTIYPYMIPTDLHNVCNKMHDIAESTGVYFDFKHAKRVKDYVQADSRYSLMNASDKCFVSTLAYAHDVVNNLSSANLIASCINNNETKKKFIEALQLLAYDEKKMTYEQHIKSIMDSNNMFVIMIKQAEMKDNLKYNETFTDYLKNKYYPAIPILLGLK